MSLLRRSLGLMSVAAALAVVPGCTEDAPKNKPQYTALPNRVVPPYLSDSVYQYSDMTGLEPFPISGYGLVANLRGTGGCRAPTAVRDYMTKELAGHQFGTFDSGYATPDKILDSKDFSIVKVEGFLPPGARAGADWSTWFDVRVSALAESDATSLAHGDLWMCDLKVGGANPVDPGNGMVSVKGQAAGAVFVNPTYVLDTDTDTPAARGSRRTGYVLAAARAMEDRPLIIRLRAPERRLVRAIERRINERFQDVADDDLQSHGNTAGKKIANAQDEAVLYVYVPKAYADHWEHFAGLVRHLYVNGDNEAFAALKATQLAKAADQDPKSGLLEISYAWEGLGKPALHALDPLLTDARPDVRFAAARAAAFIGDPGAVPVLLDIAARVGDPFRVNAVQTLGELPRTPHTDALCRALLDSDQATVRIAAYQLLCKHGDPSIYTRWVKENGKEIFALDVIRGGGLPGRPAGKPLVYASQQGIPRIAVFGVDTAIDLPMIFQTLDDHRLMIATTPDGAALTVSYRSPYRRDVVGFTCGPTLPELVSRLGGDGDTSDSTAKLHLSYGDVVAVLQALVAHQKVSGPAVADAGTVLAVADVPRVPAAFMLEQPSATMNLPISGTSLIRGQNGGGRPSADRPGDAPADPTPTPDSDLLRRPTPVTPPAPPAATGNPAGVGTTPRWAAGDQAAVQGPVQEPTPGRAVDR